MEKKDTIIAPLTSGVGGTIAALRISGSKAFSLTAQVIRDKTAINKSGGRFSFKTFFDQDGKPIDEGIVLFFKNPQSYTGEDVVEINCHANGFIIDRIIQTYLGLGCRLAEPGEFTQRAFLNGKIDLVQAEAVADIISAQSQQASQNALLQLRGRLSKKLEDIKKQIIDTTSLLELDLDFSEEDIEIIPANKVEQKIKKTVRALDELLTSFQYGKIFSNGLEVLITGKPNVGKSSLMNTLLESDRVIVSDQPGTTRDVVQEQTLIHNVVVKLTDSAGIHSTENFIEAEGIERAREIFQRCDVILLVIDNSETLNRDDFNLIKTIQNTYRNKTLFILNKSDKPESGENKEAFTEFKDRQIKISAKTGSGINDLKEMIFRLFISPADNRDEGLTLSNKRQYEFLSNTKNALVKAQKSIQENMGFEFVALDLRDAIQNLSQVTGEITSDDILNNIFSSFCIGK